MPEFVSSLPLAGEDGTLRRHFRDPDTAGRIHAKTGTLDGVLSLAGYAQTRAGRRYTFAALVNDPRTRFTRPVNNNPDDRTWSRFRFNPAYFQDLLLFRQILGTASNAAYFKPWLAFYFFDNNFSGRLDIEYAFAPQKLNTWGNKSNYGLELDLSLRYHDRQEPIFFQLQYGVMFPFGAFNRTGSYNDEGSGYIVPNNGDAKAAQALRAQLGIRF